MKQFDLVKDKDQIIGIITEIIDEHNVSVKYLSCDGEGIYCINKKCDEYDELTPLKIKDIRLFYIFIQIMLRINSYIGKYKETK